MGAAKTPEDPSDSNGRREHDSHVRAWGLLGRFLDQHTLSDVRAVERFVAEHPDDAPALRDLLRGFAPIREQKNRDREDVDVDAAPDPDAGPDDNSASRPELVELLRRIREDIGSGLRFTPGERIGSGGIGVVFKLWDANLHRHVAKKTIRADKLRPDPTQRVRWIARFLEEAQITAQLDHPGVVPIHDMGFEPDGQVYFTMRYVRGDTFADALEKVRADVDGWNRTRAVATLLRVCETMAFAHGKDVIHRDLKPSNIMVGRYGETYVMDWGLARKLGNPDLRDLRIRPPQPHSTDVRTDARQLEESGLFTVDGHAIGTPAYMSPEQARGEIERLDHSTDIYALGAILYEVIAGHPPYHEPGVRAPAEIICRWVIDGPPARLHTRAKDAPAELIAICDRAMAREPAKRYPSVEEMADDLRAFLENRVVKAYRTGPITELTKWVGRNRLAAGVASLLLLTMSTSGFLLSWQTQLRLDAERKSNNLNKYSAILARAESVIRDATELNPLDPTCPIVANHLLATCSELAREQPELMGLLARLRREYPFSGDLDPLVANQLAENYERLAMYERRLHFAMQRTSPASSSADPAVRFQETSKVRQDLTVLPTLIEQLLTDIELLRVEADYQPVRRRELPHSLPDPNEDVPFLDVIVRAARAVDLLTNSRCGVHRSIVAIRNAHDRLVRERSTSHDAWSHAVTSVANPAKSPRYAGARLLPRSELVPIGYNETSGLWEFWHPASGERPRYDNSKQLIMAPDTGLIFVLIPRSTVWMGLQNEDPLARYYYPARSPNVDRHVVEVDLFFVSKFELTQAQWYRLTNSNPSTYFAGYDSPELRPITFVHPVESLDQATAERALTRWGLRLPTEAEWLACTAFPSHFAKFTHHSPWDIETKPLCENIYNAPEFDSRLGIMCDPRDGYRGLSPVGTFPANANGLHDLHGNVSELCSDYMLNNIPRSIDLLPGTRVGARKIGPTSDRVTAGANFRSQPDEFGSVPYDIVRGLPRGTIDARYGVRAVLDAPRYD